MQKLTLALICISLGVLSGCASKEQRAAQERERQARIKAAAENLHRAIEGKCRSYGFQHGTNAFSSCVMQLDLISQETIAASRARAQQEANCSAAMGQGFLAPTRTGGFGESLGHASAAYQNCMAELPPQRSRNVICTRQGKDEVHCFTQ
jgi:hypothetical protein